MLICYAIDFKMFFSKVPEEEEVDKVTIQSKFLCQTQKRWKYFISAESFLSRG